MADEQARKRHAFSKLTRLIISLHDFGQALSAATFLLEDVEEDVEKYSRADLRRFRCYETAMVIAYARPFSMAKGEVGRLSWKDTGMPPKTATENELHEKLVKHRNTVYGHSDAQFVEWRVMVMHQYFDHNDVDYNWLYPRFEEGMRISLDEISAIHEMLHRLTHRVLLEIQRIGAEFKDRFTTYEMGIEDP
jgi:hypothetical protein